VVTTEGETPFISEPPMPAATPAASDDKPAPDPSNFITLPPGIVDSGTHRAAPRPPRAERPLSDDVVFFPTVPGIVPPPVADVADETVVAVPTRETLEWRLYFSDRAPLVITGALFIGRNPSATGALPDAELLAIADPEKTLSKTHAVLEVDGADLWVTDLNSTNGIIVIDPDDSELLVEPGVRTPVVPGVTIEFGTYPIRVDRA
jgi:hypothetical protein